VSFLSLRLSRQSFADTDYITKTVILFSSEGQTLLFVKISGATMMNAAADGMVPTRELLVGILS
jgi:hypothetical protein